MPALSLKAKSFYIYSLGTLLILQLTQSSIQQSGVEIYAARRDQPALTWGGGLALLSVSLSELCRFPQCCDCQQQVCSLALSSSKTHFPPYSAKILTRPSSFFSSLLSSFTSVGQKGTKDNFTFHKSAPQRYPLCRITGNCDNHKRQHFTSDNTENQIWKSFFNSRP